MQDLNQLSPAELIETSLDGFLQVTLEGEILAVNESYCRMIGYSREELLGQSLSLVEAREDPADTRARIEKIRREGSDRFFTYHRRKEGSLIPLEVVIRLHSGSPPSLVTFVHDLSELRKREGELKKATDEAARAEGVQRQFLAHMSHEIRTPMNSILGYSEILQARLDPGGGEVIFAERIRESGRVLWDMMEDLFGLTAEIFASGEGSSAGIPNPLPLEKSFRSLVNFYGNEARKKGLSFAVSIDPGVPSELCVEERLLRQVLLNLLGNAVKYTDQGGISLGLSARPGEGEQSGFDAMNLTISIKDTGVGFPEEGNPGDPAEGAAVKRGTGLGLSVVRRLIDVMGGALDIQSRPGGGTEAAVFLPGVLAPSGVIGLRDKLGNLPGLNGIPLEHNFPLGAPSGALPRAKDLEAGVLVVDDDISNRLLLKTLLEHQNLRVLLAEDGQEAVERVRHYRESLQMVFMDLRMPLLDGDKALGLLKEELGDSLPPVVALTGSAERAEELNLFDAVLSKPFDQDKLGGILKEFLPPAAAEKASEEDSGRKTTPLAELARDFTHLAEDQPEGCRSLREILMPLLRHTSHAISMEEAGVIADSVADYGERYDLPGLTRFGKLLKRRISLFDIAALESLFDGMLLLMGEDATDPAKD